MKVKQIFSSYDARVTEPLQGVKYCPKCGTVCTTKEDGGRLRAVCLACNFVHYHNPAPAVSILIIQDEKILLGKRGQGSFAAGKWCLPCGFIEFDEDFLTAARREVAEETGLKVEIQSIISVVSNFFSPTLHTLVVVLLAQVIGGKLCAGDDLDEVQWFYLADSLPELAFAADWHIIKRYCQTRLEGVPVEADEI